MFTAAGSAASKNQETNMSNRKETLWNQETAAEQQAREEREAERAIERERVAVIRCIRADNQ